MSLKQTQGVVRYALTSTANPASFMGKVVGLNSSGTPALGSTFAAGVVVNTERPLGSDALQLDVALFGSGLVVDVQLASAIAVTTSDDAVYADTSGTFCKTTGDIAAYPLATAAAGSMVQAII